MPRTPRHSPAWLLISALALASLCAPRTARAESTEQAPEQTQWADRVLATGQWFWLQGKAMPGLELAAGRGLVELDLELSFISLTERSPDLDGSWVGNQLGAFLMLTPLRERYFDLSLGLGGDFYLLWGIHSGDREAALAPRVVARLWPLENLAVTFMARTYLVHSEGLELGTARDGGSGPPILLSTGVTWRFF